MVLRELTALLGRQVKQVRKTCEQPARVSVIDVASALTGKTFRAASQDAGSLKERYPEFGERVGEYKFPGERQRRTPVCDARGVAELVMLLPGKEASQIRRQAACLLVRFLGGDATLIEEVCRNRAVQQGLAGSPEHPLRLFGDAVEGPAGDAANDRVINMCEQILARALPQAIRKLTDHIDERFTAFESQRCRPGPYAIDDTPSAQPLSLPTFLQSKERLDPDFARARRQYTPAFTMLVSILKHDAMKASGRTVAQDKRSTYTEADKHIMNTAWEVSTAYRESLLGRQVAAAASPSVLEMLQVCARA